MSRTRVSPRAALALAIVAGCLLHGVALAQTSSSSSAPAGSTEEANAVVPPELIEFAEATYPVEARAAGREGAVILALDVDDTGRVVDVRVVEGAGHGFDEAASEAAKRFRFQPATRGNRPVAAKILYRYAFHLERGEVERRVDHSRLSGRITVAGSESALVGARIRLLLHEKVVGEATIGPSGAFAIDELAPGAYRVEVSAAGYQPFSSLETLEASEETEVRYGLLPIESGENEVTVLGARPRREVTRRTLSRRELTRIPGTSGDALRAIQNLPGVARPPALSGLLVVRGNADQTTPVLIDGMWIPNVYHFGGLSSVIPSEMLDEINFYPGNFSVRYGRALAGVVEGSLRKTRKDGRYHGLLQLDLIDARALLEGPIPLAGGWNFIGGFRRSHVDAWLIPLIGDSEDTQISGAPVYYDYQLLVDNRPTRDSYLRIGLLGFDDRIRIINEASASGGELDAASSTWGIGSIYELAISDDTEFELTLTGARQHQRFHVSAFDFDLVALGLITRGEITHRPFRGLTLRSGYDVLFGPYSLRVRLPEEAAPGAPDLGSAVSRPVRELELDSHFLLPAVYGELALRPSRPAELVSGVRLDYTWESKRLDVSPRITGRYEIVPEFPKTALKAGTGLFHQAPQLFELLLREDDTPLRSTRAWQNSLGVEQDLSKNVMVSLEGFLNLLDDLVVRAPRPDGALEYTNLGTGRIFGAELMLRYQNDPRLFGWLSYTLSRSERRYVPGEPSRLFDLDQTHILTALGSYELGRGWEFGARFRYVSGNLQTPCRTGLFSSAQTSYLCVPGEQNGERLPPFHQLDLRVDKRWRFDAFTIGAYLDLINAYNHTNTDFYSYQYDFSRRRAQTASLPFVPSFGLRGEF